MTIPPPAPASGALRTVRATRYVTPLREGGSLPALVEADDDGLYVVKFRGAGQGPKALVAEVVAGEIARAAGLPVPEVVFVDLDPRIAGAEPDPEIQDLLRASGGVNAGLDFLPGALPFDTACADREDPEFAARVVWLDAALTNIDRTARNPNMLRWHGRTWLIDHGAALYQQHAPGPLAPRADRPFAGSRDHVLLPCAGDLHAAQLRMRDALRGWDPRTTLDALPDAWVCDDEAEMTYSARRDDYAAFLHTRLFERDVAADVEGVRP